MRFAIIFEILSYLVWSIASILVTALLTSWALSHLWRWFVSAQYGAGPSAGAWFGIAVITRLILRGPELPRGDDEDDRYELREIMRKDLIAWAGILVALLVVWSAGSAVGWVR